MFTFFFPFFPNEISGQVCEESKPRISARLPSPLPSPSLPSLPSSPPPLPPYPPSPYTISINYSLPSAQSPVAATTKQPSSKSHRSTSGLVLPFPMGPKASSSSSVSSIIPYMRAWCIIGDGRREACHLWGLGELGKRGRRRQARLALALLFLPSFSSPLPHPFLFLARLSL